jgi:hypothetical protein
VADVAGIDLVYLALAHEDDFIKSFGGHCGSFRGL